MRKPLILLTAFTLAACGPADERVPMPSGTPAPLSTDQPAPPSGSAQPKPGAVTPAADECGADRLGGYLNQPATSDTLAKIRAAAGHERIRTIRPGDAVTMDFRPDRLNIEIGDDGRIKRLRCG